MGAKFSRQVITGVAHWASIWVNICSMLQDTIITTKPNYADEVLILASSKMYHSQNMEASAYYDRPAATYHILSLLHKFYTVDWSIGLYPFVSSPSVLVQFESKNYQHLHSPINHGRKLQT